MKLNFRRLLAMFLSIVMVAGMLPAAVFAEDGVETQSETNVAQVGDTTYTSLQAAIDKAQSGDEIILLRDTAEDVTIPAGVIFNGNGKQVGVITAAGEITFKGYTKATNFGAQYTNTTINIGKGACLEITGTGRMIIGYGCTFNITGTITNAKTANTADLTPSLIMPGASFTGAGVNFNVTDAYVKFTAYCSSKNSNASDTFNINVTNSIWEQTGSLVFSEPTNEKDPTFNFNVKDSVLNSTSHLVFAVTKGEIVFDNSNVNVGTPRQIENRSTMIVKNGSVVKGAVGASANAKNPGTLIIGNATYAVTGEFSGSDLGTGTLIVNKDASFTAGSITNANIKIDATGMQAGDTINNITANLSNHVGTIEVVNSNLGAEIVDGKIVLVEAGGLSGTGTAEDPFLINNLEELKWFRDSVNTYTQDGSNQYKGKYVKLTADIDLAGINWTPIGTNTVGDHAYFKGIFYGEKADGTIPTISNLYINADGDHLGFFARVGSYDEGITPTVKNITFNNVDVSSNTTTGHGGSYVAGVIANAGGNSVVSGVKVTGNVYVAGYGYVGGIVGHGYPDIDNCSVVADEGSYIHCHYWCCGGIIGYAGEGGTPITDSSVSGVDIWSAYGAAAAVAGLLQDGNKLENVSASNVEITSNSDYCMGYIAGNGECSTMTNITANNVTVTAKGNPITSTDAVASVNGTIYFDLQTALDAAAAGDTIVLLTDATPDLTSQRAITKASSIDLNGKTLTLTEDDLYFGTTTFRNGKIVVDSSVVASTAVFWMFENQTLTFDNVEIVATGVTGTYLIGINGGTGTAINLTNGSKITIENDSTAGLTAVICDNGTGNSVVIEGSTINVTNIEGRLYLGGTNGKITVKDSTVTANGVKEGFYLRAGQTLAIEGTSNVEVALNDTNGRYGINVTDETATYTKADTATVDATVYTPTPAVTYVAYIGEQGFESLDAAIAAAAAGDTILLTADIDYGTDQLKLEKAITLDLGGKTLTTRNAWGGMSVKNNPTIKNGTIVHASNTAAIKVWNATAFEDLVIDVQGKGDANKTIGGIVLQEGSTTHVGSIKNVTIEGVALTNGIETYNCGNATEPVIGSMENVTIDAKSVGLNISAPCGTATNCSIKGGTNGIEIWIKGTYSATLDLFSCNVEGGVFAHDEFSSDPSIVNNGKLKLTADTATTGASEDAITLTIARAEKVEGILKNVMDNAQAKVNDTYYATLASAIDKAQNGDVITIISDIQVTTENCITNSSNYAVMYNVAGKSVTIDLNGKSITVSADADDLTSAEGTMLMAVFAVDTNGTLTLKDSIGTGSVNVTANGAKVYSLACAYGEASKLYIESGSYTADAVSSALIYSQYDEVVTVSGGNFHLENVGTGNNGSPWIFNASGQNTQNIIVTGGTFNADVFHQYYIFEVKDTTEVAELLGVPVKAARDNRDGTWTIVDAVAYVDEQHKSGNWYTQNTGYATLEEALEAAGKYANDGKGSTVTLVADATLDYGAREAFASNANGTVTINGNGKTLTLNQTNSDWSSFGLANADAKLVLNNVTIEKTGKGDTSGAWNTHAIIFSCNVEMNNVTVNNSVAVQNGATLNNVKINEANGYYGLWINGNGQSVTVNGSEINAENGGRGIKIADQYIDSPVSVNLAITDTKFNTAKKAAVLVSSKAGAAITASGCDISNVAEDKVNLVWVDEAWADYNDKVTVNGGTKFQEGTKVSVAKIGETMYETLAEALTAAVDDDIITLIWAEGDAPIAMNGAVYGKTVTITGTATVDWSKGFLFVGRGGTGNGTVIFDNANLTSASDSSSYGIHVSGREKDTPNKYDGTLIIKNSTIELDYLINRGTIELDKATLTVKNGFGIAGRPASETESGTAATATVNITNGSYVKVLNHNGMGVGVAATINEGYGVLNLTDSTFECANFNINGDKLDSKTLGDFNVYGGSTLKIDTLTGREIDLHHNAIIKDSTVGGEVMLYGKVTFRGANTFAMLYDYGAAYSTDSAEWLVEAGASLTLTEKARYGLGYGDKVTIYGSLTDALNARKTLTDKDIVVFMHGLVAQESTGWNKSSSLTVKDAYVVLGSNNSFGNKPGNYGGTYTFEFDNVVLDSSRITFYEAGSTTEFTFNKSDVKVGTFMIRDEDSVFTLTDTKLVSTTTFNGNDEGNYLAGTLVLNNSSLSYEAPLEMEDGTLTLGAGSSLTADSIIGTGKIIIDATGMTAGKVTTIDANASGFTGTIEVIKNDKLTAEIDENGNIVLVEVKTYVAKIGDVGYESLADAIDAAQPGETIVLIADITEDVTISKNLTIYGAEKKYTGNILVDDSVNKNVEVTIKKVNFGTGSEYAITTSRIKSITVEDCSVNGRSFLNAKLSTPSITVKNVTITGGNYVAYIVHGDTAYFENVTATAMTGYGIFTQNYGAKTITLKNCSFETLKYKSIDVRYDRTSAVDTFIFEGNNTMTSMYNGEYAKYVLGATDATLTAPEGLNVTTTVDGYEVKYADGKYTVVEVEEVEPAGTITSTGHSISLEGNIWINKYATFEGFEDIDLTKDAGLLIWTSEISEEDAVYGAEGVIVKEGLLFSKTTADGKAEYGQITDGIVAPKYGDKLYMRFYVNVGDHYEYGAFTAYSVEDYCRNKIEKSSNESLKKLCVAVLNYGAQAQIKFNHNPDDLVNAGIDSGLVTAFSDDMIIALDETFTTQISPSSNVTSNGRSISLDEGITINYYYKASGFTVKTAELLTWSDVEGELTYENAEKTTMIYTGSEYGARGALVPAAECGDTIYACARFTDTEGNVYYSAVTAYSAHQYAANQIAKGKNVDLLKAFIVYSNLANEYFNK